MVLKQSDTIVKYNSFPVARISSPQLAKEAKATKNVCSPWKLEGSKLSQGCVLQRR